MAFKTLGYYLFYPHKAGIQCHGTKPLNRGFMGWFIAIWNKVDPERIKEVGPDRACAEWLLRCGAGIKWKGAGTLLNDYNALPRGDFRRLKIQEIHAVNAAVMEEGFSHLRALTELKKVTMSDCKYVTDDSLIVFINNTRDRLESFELSCNGNITDRSIGSITRLEKLKELKLEKLAGVENPEKLLKLFDQKMPECRVQWPPFTPLENNEEE